MDINNDKFNKLSKSYKSKLSNISLLCSINKEKHYVLIIIFNSIKYLDPVSVINLMEVNKYIYNLLISFETIFILLKSSLNNNSYKYFKTLLNNNSNINNKILGNKNKQVNSINKTINKKDNNNNNNNNTESYFNYFGSLINSYNPLKLIYEENNLNDISNKNYGLNEISDNYYQSIREKLNLWSDILDEKMNQFTLENTISVIRELINNILSKKSKDIDNNIIKLDIKNSYASNTNDYENLKYEELKNKLLLKDNNKLKSELQLLNSEINDLKDEIKNIEKDILDNEYKLDIIKNYTDIKLNIYLCFSNKLIIYLNFHIY